MEPELWTRCPKAKQFRNGRWWCKCHYYDTLVRVPDGAVERMLDALGGLEGPMNDERVMIALLAAAVGGEGL